MGTRECPFCGKTIGDNLTHCSRCREPLPEMPRSFQAAPSRSRATANDGSSHTIRRGLLYMFLAAVIGYFASGSSPWMLPVSVPHAVTIYLVPLLFVSGLVLSLYGFYKRNMMA